MRLKLLRGSVSAFCLLSAAPALAQPAPIGDSQGNTKGGASEQPPVQQDEAPSEEADPTQSGRIEDILVTAQRRSENIQDVPIAISAFSADQLQAQGVTNTLQLGQYVPNLVAQTNTGIGSANAYFLRGLGNTESIATFDPPVGTYVDDIYLSRQNANNLSFFDVERIEVLRGPQGTLFGRNTTGGAINVILREPGEVFGGFAELGYGSFNRVMGRLSVDLPITSGLAIKLSGYYQDDEGYARNVTTGERVNDDDGWGARIGVRAELSDNINWVASYAHIVNQGENLVNFECNPAAPSECDGRYVTTGLRQRPDGSIFRPIGVQGRKADLPLGQESATNLITSNFEVGLGEDFTLNLITGYVHIDQQFALDFFDGRGGPSIANPIPPVRGFARGGFDIINDGQHAQFTQEIKLNGSLFDDRVKFVAGLFYIDENNVTDFADTFTLSPALSIVLADRIVRNTTSSIAGYVQADFRVTDALTLTAGIRYTDETKTFAITDNRLSCNDGSVETTCLDTRNLRAANGAVIPDEQTARLWTPRFAASYRPNDDLLLFASATRGFKSGGWNARSTAPSQLLPFDPEVVWSYEAGFKSDWFDRRLRLNVTAFHLDVEDLQTISGLINPTTGAIVFLNRNFAGYRNRGVEVELSVNPIPGLSLFANGGYQDDEYVIDLDTPAFDEFGVQSVPAQQAACLAALAAGRVPGGPNTAACAAGIVTATGAIATPVRTPDFTFALGASYEAQLGGGLRLIPSVNASYRGDQEVATSNFTIFSGAITGTNGTFPANPNGGDVIVGSRTDAAWLVNASLTFAGRDDKWRLSIECSNCFDESFFQNALANYSYLNPPATWMARARLNF